MSNNKVLMTSHRNIIVLDYKKKWKNEFERLKMHYLDTLGELLIAVEHVGSTSVRGLASKPILDIDLVIGAGTFDEVKEGLESIGYNHVGDQGIRGREVFKLDPNLKDQWHKHHLYVCHEGSEELFRMKLFRDYLRSHPQVAEEYGIIKKEAATRFPHDIDGYMDHKGPFIVQILNEAFVWADTVPHPDLTSCEKCKSNDIEFDFRIIYEGQGKKREEFEISCLQCFYEWIEVT